MFLLSLDRTPLRGRAVHHRSPSSLSIHAVTFLLFNFAKNEQAYFAELNFLRFGQKRRCLKYVFAGLHFATFRNSQKLSATNYQ